MKGMPTKNTKDTQLVLIECHASFFVPFADNQIPAFPAGTKPILCVRLPWEAAGEDADASDSAAWMAAGVQCLETLIGNMGINLGTG